MKVPIRPSNRLARGLCLLMFGATAPLLAQGQPEKPSFVHFESGPVRPLAVSPSGDRLFAVNTPDNRLEVFAITGSGLEPAGSVAVGLEPVAVAARTDSEVWVVNHLSDSVSVVDLSAGAPRVVRTLLVGDEPRDIVFAGGSASGSEGGERAFVTTAHRGQHRTHPGVADVPGAGDPRFLEPGVDRADVWVFDATNPAPGGDGGSALGGKPLRIVTLFGDTPRALAASPDGSTVWVAVFHSGNQTTTVSAGVVCPGFAETDSANACPEHFSGSPGGSPGPATNRDGVPAPHVGLVVKYDKAAREWRDELGRGWNNGLRFTLADQDVFAIDATSLEVEREVRHVGTVLFNMVVNPRNGKLYVSNTEARNEVRFEGPGRFGGTTVQGRLAEARITVIDGDAVTPRHLNKHIDYDVRPAPPGVRAHSLATPLQMAVSSDGETLYVSAFGSSKVGVYDTAALEDDSFDPEAVSAGHIPVSGGGPSGLALDEARGRLYVATRFDNGVSVVDLATRAEVAHLRLPSPEPARVVEGRRFLYDARVSSSNGEASCASCHVFADMDGLAWNLGDPDGRVTRSPIEIVFGADLAEFLFPGINGSGNGEDFHPMKGPMTTQTLRGMVNSGAMHWRGDRAAGAFGVDPFDTDLSFRNFNPAFVGLLGATAPLAPEQMQAFADFALDVTLPPNPVRNLDNTLTAEQRAGADFFFGPRRSDGLEQPSPLGFTCVECHTTDAAAGHFGTDGRQSFETEPQIFKIPHLRNAYQKVGLFGTPRTADNGQRDPGDLGEQVRGTGYLHDGSIDTLFRFFSSNVFAQNGDVGFRSDAERIAMSHFMLAFDTDLAPIVGQQVTLDAAASAETLARVDLLEARASAPFTSKVLGGDVNECDLVVKGTIDGEQRGAAYDLELGAWVTDRDSDAPLTSASLRALASQPGQELTFTCVPPGSGVRIGVDRDLDGFFDRDELDAGSDPGDPADRPRSCVPRADRLCLQAGRFAVTVDWSDSARFGAGALVPGASDDSGLLWFFSSDNWEMLIKVLDGCAINDRYWFFSAASTTIGYRIQVRDLVANEVVTYDSPLGAPAQTIGDTSAFATCGVEAASATASRSLDPPRFRRDPESAIRTVQPEVAGPQPDRRGAGDARIDPGTGAEVGAAVGAGGACAAGGGGTCLQEGRFRIAVTWRTTGGESGAAGRVPLPSDDSALLWFFGPDVWEMLVKVLDGCSTNGHYWVFSSAATDVEYTLEVTDTTSGETRAYANPLGALSSAVADTSAFAACP
jgi:DNA-binding beta-propeller fold protein YncE